MSDAPPVEDYSTSTEAQLPLYNRQAEEAVLGAVLIYPDSFFDVAQVVRAEDFYIIRNRWIWESFTRLQSRRAPIDYLMVSQELEEQNQLAEAGGQAYLTSLMSQVPSSLHAEHYAHIIEEASLRRRLVEAANDVAKMAYNRQVAASTVLEEAGKAIFGITQRQAKQDLQPIRNVLSNVYDQVETLSQRTEEIFGVPTGLYDLDRLLGGLQKSDLLIVAGRPGSGKTGFMLSIAKNAAQKHKKHVAMFSLEMSSEQLAQRLIAQETGIDTLRLRTGKLQEDEWPLFTHAIEVLADTHIYLDDTAAITPLQLSARCRRLANQYQLDLVIIDYLQLMNSDLHTENRVQEVSYISRTLKVLARELNVPVLAAAQLSRAVEQRTDKLPVLSDLRESGSLEQDADIVMFIHRPHANEPEHPRQNVAQIIVAKHRNGPTHSGIEMVFLNNTARFENAASPDQGR